MRKAWLAAAAALAIGGALRPQPLLSHEVVNTTVTFDKEIARILSRKCIACHSEHNLAMPFTSYEQTRPWSRAIEEEVLRRHMPPWQAVPGYGQFANDLGLTNRELQFIVAWVEGNGPKTKDQRLIVNVDQGKTPERERLRPDFERWQLGKPDLLKALPAYSVAPGQGGQVRRVTLDLEITSDRWIRAMEFKPGDRRVVRAVFFSLQETGQWLGSWTPWYVTTTLPRQTAYRVPAGAHIVADIHYRSASQPVDDRATLGVYFAPGPPARAPSDLVVEAKGESGGEAASTSHRRRFSGSITVSDDVNVLTLKPDIPAGVESIQVSARQPNGAVQVLLLLRDVLPEWPTPYVFKDPVGLPKNTELSVTAYASSTATPPPAGVTVTASVVTARPPAAGSR